MSPFTAVAIYMTIWWTALFVILPLNVKSFHEAGIEPPAGVDPAAPVNPNLKRKFITTSWLSAIIWLVLFVIMQFKLINGNWIPVL